MNGERLAILGAGVHSSLGGLVHAGAAYRAQLSRASELVDWPIIDETTKEIERVVGHPACGIEKGYQGFARFQYMMRFALDDFASRADMNGLRSESIGVYFAFSDLVDDEHLSFDLSAAWWRLHEYIADWRGKHARDSRSHALFRGRLAFPMAVRRAADAIVSGKYDSCLIITIDSLIDANRLSELLTFEYVKTADCPTGFMPGEACTVFWVGDRAKSLDASATISVPCFSKDVDWLPAKDADNVERVTPDEESEAASTVASSAEVLPEPSLGCVTAELVGATVGQRTAESMTVFADLNGEEYRATELGTAMMRLKKTYDVDRWRIKSIATGFGETGAVCPSLAACIAYREHQRHYSYGPASLVLAFTAYGEGAAFQVYGGSYDG